MILEGSIMKLVDTPREREDVEEGNTILLRCTVSNLQGTAQWSKNEAIIYDQYTPDYNDRDHYVMVGNGTIGDFSLELRNANLEDTAQYTCTIRPKKDDIRIPPLVAKTNVTVLPHQSLEASKKQAPQRSSDSKQAREALNLPELVHPAGSNNSPPGTHHKQQAAGFVTPQQHHYSNINAFAGPTISSHSVQSQPGPNALGSTQYRASSTPGPSGPLQLFILWPYLLLGLAALLFMANIYLICSLYRRHKRARAHQRHHAPANEGSLESGSNGGCSSSNLADENDSQARLKNLSR